MDTTQNLLLRKMLEGIKRTKGKKDCRLPITKDLLCKIITTTSSVCNTDFEARLFSASFSLAYYAFLRVGDFTYSNDNQSHHIISLHDIKLSKCSKSKEMVIELTIPSSKADQLGKGCKLFIEQTKDSICPVNLIRKYMAVRPNANGQFFIHFDTSPLTLYQFVSLLNKILKLIGLP